MHLPVSVHFPTVGESHSHRATDSHCCFQTINVTVTMDNLNIVYLSLSIGDLQTTILMLRLIHPGVGITCKSEMMHASNGQCLMQVEAFYDGSVTTPQITLPFFIQNNFMVHTYCISA